MQKQQTRITVRISSRMLTALDARLRELHLRRDAYLNHTLWDEVELLDRNPANSPRAQRYLRLSRGAIPDKTRLAITLDADLVKKINSVCKSKGVVRDAFIESYITFLVLGDNGGCCISPLVKAAAILNDPRYDYDHSDPAYGDLYLSDEDLEAKSKPLDLAALFEGISTNEYPTR